MEASTTPRWLSMIRACLAAESSPATSRFLQLGTVGLDGRPAVRTVVFRGWHATSLLAVTDTRSSKIPELRALPYAELCWYFQDARQQFRLTGPTKVLTAHDDPSDNTDTSTDWHHLRTHTWQNLSPSARLQFAYPPPGRPRASLTPDSTDPFSPDAPDAETPPDTFALLVVTPVRVDVVDLRQNTRTLYTSPSSSSSDGHEWVEQEINP